MPLGAVLPGPHVELKPPLAVDPRALGGIAQLVGGIAEQHDADELHVVARADRDAKAQILLAGLRGFQFGVADQRAIGGGICECVLDGGLPRRMEPAVRPRDHSP